MFASILECAEVYDGLSDLGLHELSTKISENIAETWETYVAMKSKLDYIDFLLRSKDKFEIQTAEA